MLLAAVTASALVLTACGSSSSSTSSSAAAPASSAAAPASAPAASGAASSGAASSGGASASGAPASSGAAMASGAAPTALTPAQLAAAKATLVDPSSLTVCTSLPYSPFEVDDGTGSGKIVGFDMDLMDLMAKELGVQRKTVALQFPGIQSGQAMKSKKCDIAAAAMTINEERKANITFSDPYYDASQALMVPADSSVTGLADLKGKKLGAQTGTTGLMYAQKYQPQYGYTVTQYSQINDEELALSTGKVDAAIHDQPALNDYLKQHPGKAKVVANFKTGEQYGFGMALGNTALKAAADNAIATAKADGAYAAAYKKWIGTPAAG
jgi:polar amino acid transport system substrate-binding protein